MKYRLWMFLERSTFGSTIGEKQHISNTIQPSTTYAPQRNTRSPGRQKQEWHHRVQRIHRMAPTAHGHGADGKSGFGILRSGGDSG